MDTEQPWIVEYNASAEGSGMYPWHITLLSAAVGIVPDDPAWEVVFRGSFEGGWAYIRTHRVRSCLTNALSALGDRTGDCQINQCDGCKDDVRSAIDWIEEALSTMGGPEDWLVELRQGKG